MAKLYFHYSTMNAGKSTLLLQASYNYRERGMETYLLTAAFDGRAGKGKIGSRIGIRLPPIPTTPAPIFSQLWISASARGRWRAFLSTKHSF